MPSAKASTISRSENADLAVVFASRIEQLPDKKIEPQRHREKTQENT